MADVVARSNSPLQPPAAAPEKAIRNKRKFRADPPAADPNTLALPFQPECPSYDLFDADKAPESFNLEHLASICDMCKTLVCSPEEGLEMEGLQDADWSDLTETQLEEILLSNMDIVFKNAIKTVSSYGYPKEVARNAVLMSGVQYCCKDAVSSIVENALALLRGGQEVGSDSRGKFPEDLQKVERSMLAAMVNMVREAQPFFSTGDAMWCLLICDMNVSRACALDYDPFSGTRADEASGAPVVHHVELDPKSNIRASLAAPQPNENVHERLSAMLPGSQMATKSEIPMVLGASNSIYGRPPISSNVSSNVEGMISNLKHDHVEVAPSQIATQSFKDENPINGRKLMVSGSKKESILRQKAAFEKSFRAFGSKAALRACKHGTVGNSVFDRKPKSTSESKSISLKSSLRASKDLAVDVSHADATAAHSSSSLSTKPSSSPTPFPLANTELSLSLPSTSSCPAAADQDCSVQVPNCTNYDVYSYDKMPKDWVPQDRKDEMALKLVPFMRELQAQKQDWTDWAQQKVMQAARRLGKDKDELQSLRQEKEEAGRFQEEARNLKESTRKKLAELEGAIAKASGQVERDNAVAFRLEVENARLRLEMEAAKLQAAESAANCRELSRKEAQTLKKFQSWETHRSLLQEEMVADKNKQAHLQQQLQQAKEHHDQWQKKLRQEENAKNEALTLTNTERKEREQIETSARSQENTLLLKAENDLQRYKNDIRGLEQQISRLRLSMEPLKLTAPRWGTDKSYASRLSNGRKNGSTRLVAKIEVSQDLEDEDDIQREWECVMCLSEEMSVVFLPCAHQVVCTKCNDLHEKQGMKDCPSCRTLIQQRICIRPAGS